MDAPEPTPPEPPPGFDLERMYRDIGRFIVFFQTVENQVWQLGVLALGLDAYDRSRRKLSGLSFKELCTRTQQAVFARLDAGDHPVPEYRARIEAVLERCDKLRAYRNRMVHSAYVFMEAGDDLLGVMRSDIRKGPEPDGLTFDQEDVTPETFVSATNQLAAVVFELGLCRTQLIAWS
jgi:hypothetical protein